MSETINNLSGEERRARIRDIRARKGHLLGRGFVVEGHNPGFVPAVPTEDPLKYSVLVEIEGEERYVYKGVPESSVRQIAYNQSEYAEPNRPLASLARLEALDLPEVRAAIECMAEEIAYGNGRARMNAAVLRQQHMLAEQFASERRVAEDGRSDRLNRYLGLLADLSELPDQSKAEELQDLAQEFFLPRSVDEEIKIIDAGGITYGI